MSPDPMNPRGKKQVVDLRNWYSLSVDTLRGWGILVVLGLAGLFAFHGYQYLQELSVERQAMIVIEEAAMKLGRVQREATGGTGSETYNEAWQSLQSARQELAKGDYQAALVSARWASNLFSSLLDDMRNKAPSGDAQFLRVQGGVEFRRGEGPWQLARSRIVLRSGDYVKTNSSGSAEVAFADGTNFSVRPNTVVLINRGQTESGSDTQDAVMLQYGWINLNTTESLSRVQTPEAEATVEKRSRVELAYDRQRRASRFASHLGSMEIRTRVGTIRRVGTREMVTMSTAGLSPTVKLPETPDPLWPNPEALFKVADEEVVLRWQTVDGVERYALQICRDDFFIDNVIDVEDRTGNSAKIGFLDEGEFLWRVAAFNQRGFKGPWSEPRAFYVEASPSEG